MRIFTRTLTAAALLAATSCGSTVRTGDSPMFLVINTLSGIRGGPTAGQASAILFSDVETFLTTGFDIVTGAPCSANVPCGVVYTDNGVATLELAKKDVTTATAPTSNNQVTINRIHVHYRVSPSGQTGVTAPADFDTFSTVTVPPTGTATVAFELVRSALKSVSPLFDLRTGGQIGVTADVTFFGTDQTGHAISATGSIQIEFANWGD